jgi:hypothetical protein
MPLQALMVAQESLLLHVQPTALQQGRGAQ